MKKFRVLKQLHSVDWFILLVALLAFALSAIGIFNNYLFGDDFNLLWGAYLHSKKPIDLLTVFIPGQVFGTRGAYRPIPFLFFLLGYKIWGMNHVGYQLMLSFLFSISAVYFYKIGKLLKGKTVGALASLFFLVFIPNFSYTWYISGAWWGTFMLAFLTIGIFNGMLWLKEEKKKHLILCLITAIFATLSKEPSLIFGPLIVAYALLCHSGNNRKRGLLLGVTITVVTIAIFLLFQVFLSDTPIRGRVPLIINTSFILSVFRAYIKEHIFLFGIPLIYLVTLGFARKWRYHIILPLLLVILVCHSKFYPLFLVLISMCFLFGRPQQRFAIAWFFIGLSYTLTGLYFPQVLYRFMLESSLGMCLLIGLSLEDYVSRFKLDFRWRKFLENFKENLRDRKSLRILKSLSSTMGMLTAAVLFLIASYSILHRAIVYSHYRIEADHTMTQNMRDVFFYIKRHLPQGTIKLVREGYGLSAYSMDWDYRIYYDASVTVLKSNIYDFGLNPVVNKRQAINYLGKNEEIYVIGPLNYLFDFLLSHRYNPLSYSAKREVLELGTILNIYNGNKVQVKVTEKNVAIDSSDSKVNFIGNKGKEPSYVIAEFKGKELIESLIILGSPRVVNDPKRENHVSILYSKDGNIYSPVFKFSGVGPMGEWNPIMFDTVCRTIFPRTGRVYLKFQFFGASQLWIPTVIVNREIEDFNFILLLSPDDINEPIAVSAHIEKVFGIDGKYPIGVLKLKNIREQVWKKWIKDGKDN